MFDLLPAAAEVELREAAKNVVLPFKQEIGELEEVARALSEKWMDAKNKKLKLLKDKLEEADEKLKGLATSV